MGGESCASTVTARSGVCSEVECALVCCSLSCSISVSWMCPADSICTLLDSRPAADRGLSSAGHVLGGSGWTLSPAGVPLHCPPRARLPAEAPSTPARVMPSGDHIEARPTVCSTLQWANRCWERGKLMLYPPGRIAAYFAYDDESLLSPVPFTRGSLFL